jgi:hypothetical protein
VDDELAEVGVEGACEVPLELCRREPHDPSAVDGDPGLPGAPAGSGPRPAQGVHVATTTRRPDRDLAPL